MRPATLALIRDVAKRYGVAPAEIVSRIKPRRLLRARIEVAQALAQRGYNGPQIGAVLNRDYTTVYYYLGRLIRKPRLKNADHRRTRHDKENRNRLRPDVARPAHP